MYLQKLAENSSCIMRHITKKNYFLLKVAHYFRFLFSFSKSVKRQNHRIHSLVSKISSKEKTKYEISSVNEMILDSYFFKWYIVYTVRSRKESKR